jgi:hypothetical protein
VGLAWNGSIQSFIFAITMEGVLDPEWVAKQLGEPPPSKDTKKKPAAGGGAGKSEKPSPGNSEGDKKKDTVTRS